MRDDGGPPAERVEALGRELGVRWFNPEEEEEGQSGRARAATFAGKRNKRYRSRTPDPARNEDAEIAATYENELSKLRVGIYHIFTRSRVNKGHSGNFD